MSSEPEVVRRSWWSRWFVFSVDARTNTAIPSLVQVVTGAKTYRNKVAPSPLSAPPSGPRAQVDLHGDIRPKAEPESEVDGEENEFVRSTRETVMEATINGLINKVRMRRGLNFSVCMSA